MSARHTRGPWRCGRKLPFRIYGSDNSQICIVDVAQRANARLIATAPELLEACKHLLACLSLMQWEDSPAAAAARATIAKATGADV